MTRALDSALEVEVQEPEIVPILLVKLAFDSSDVNVWTGIGDLSFGGDTYSGVGDLGGVSELEETIILRSSGVTFTLSGIPSSLLSIALAEDYSERFAKMWFAVIDYQAKTFIGTPYLAFSGRMDVMDIDEGPEVSTISLSCENRLVDLERPKIRRYTSEDQKIDFPSDLGLDFVAGINDGKSVIWGKG